MRRLPVLLLFLLVAALTAESAPSDAFIENNGQWPEPVRFRLQLDGLTLWITDHGALYDLSGAAAATSDAAPWLAPRRGHVVRAEFDGASRRARAVGVDVMSGRVNHFIGDDPERWGCDCRRFSSVRIEEIYDGIDIRFYLDGGLPRYDLIAAPGADIGRVRMRLAGADGVSTAPGGRLLIGTSIGELEMREMVTYQVNEKGERCQAASRFVVDRDGSVRFAVDGHDPSRELVVDPLIYSTLIGSTGDEQIRGIAVDATGHVYTVGHATAGEFDFYPTTVGAYDGTHGGATDIIVTKLEPSGSALVYSTLIGGVESDYGFAIAIDEEGNAYVAGGTTTTTVTGRGYPTTDGAYGREYRGDIDAVVTKLDPSGSALLYSTIIGGVRADMARAIAVDGEGRAVVAGSTTHNVDAPADDYPTTAGAFATLHAGQSDAFVTRLSADGSALDYSTFLGAASEEIATGIAVDEAGSAYVTGNTMKVAGFEPTIYPTTSGAFATTHHGQIDVFITKLSVDGSRLIYSTLLGGASEDAAQAIAIDATGAAYVTGIVVGSLPEARFPTTITSYSIVHGGLGDAFVTKLSADGSSLLYSTYIGGAQNEAGHGIAVDGNGNAYVAGITLHPGAATPLFPTTSDAYSTTHGGRYDLFVAKLNASGSRLDYSTLMGGAGADYAYGIARDASGIVYVGGSTTRIDAGEAPFPTTPGAFATEHQGAGDAFVAALAITTSFTAIDGEWRGRWLDLR